MKAIFTTLEKKRKRLPGPLLRALAATTDEALSEGSFPKKYWDALSTTPENERGGITFYIEQDVESGKADPDVALKWAAAARKVGWDTFDVGDVERFAKRERVLKPLLRRIKGKRSVHVRVVDPRINVPNVVIHPSTRPGEGPSQISTFDKKMEPWGHRMWRGSMEDALRHVWKENGPFELVDLSESALARLLEAQRVVQVREPRKIGRGDPDPRYDWGGEKGFSEDDRLVLYHGFRDGFDAVPFGHSYKPSIRAAFISAWEDDGPLKVLDIAESLEEAAGWVYEARVLSREEFRELSQMRKDILAGRRKAAEVLAFIDSKWTPAEVKADSMLPSMRRFVEGRVVWDRERLDRVKRGIAVKTARGDIRYIARSVRGDAPSGKPWQLTRGAMRGGVFEPHGHDNHPSMKAAFLDAWDWDGPLEIIDIVEARRLVAEAFEYGLRLRPPGLGAVPKGFTKIGTHPRFRHGTVSYARELTPDEVRSFELEPLFGKTVKRDELLAKPRPTTIRELTAFTIEVSRAFPKLKKTLLDVVKDAKENVAEGDSEREAAGYAHQAIAWTLEKHDPLGESLGEAIADAGGLAELPTPEFVRRVKGGGRSAYHYVWPKQLPGLKAWQAKNESTSVDEGLLAWVRQKLKDVDLKHREMPKLIAKVADAKAVEIDPYKLPGWKFILFHSPRGDCKPIQVSYLTTDPGYHNGERPSEPTPIGHDCVKTMEQGIKMLWKKHGPLRLTGIAESLGESLDEAGRKANGSILVNGGAKGSYGVRVESDGSVSWCSERQAALDPRGPVEHLSKRYPHLTFQLVMDNGDAYYEDLRKDLFGEALDEAAMPSAARTAFDSAPYANMRLFDVARLLRGAAGQSKPNVSLITKLVDRLIHALEFTIYSIQGRPEGRQIGTLLRQAFNLLSARLPELALGERREVVGLTTKLNEAVETLDIGPVEAPARITDA